MTDDDSRPRPASLGDLFMSFTVLALQGFGGVLAVVQRELVEKKGWLTREEFVEEWAVAQIMPGPNVVNLGITLGGRYFGWRGSVAAVAGLISAPLVIVLVLALLYSKFAASTQLAGALRGMGAVAAGLIAATGIKLVPALKKNALGVPIAALVAVATFVAVAWLRLPLAWVLAGVGGISCVVAYRRLA
ncbi:MAG: chromate transporter [Burkholderiales bacterium]|nr:chromate transporter [Burkholderiales bacterium]